MILILPLTLIFLTLLWLVRRLPLDQISDSINADLKCIRQGQSPNAEVGEHCFYRVLLNQRLREGHAAIHELYLLKRYFSSSFLQRKKQDFFQSQLKVKIILALGIGLGMRTMYFDESWFVNSLDIVVFAISFCGIAAVFQKLIARKRADWVASSEFRHFITDLFQQDNVEDTPWKADLEYFKDQEVMTGDDLAVDKLQLLSDVIDQKIQENDIILLRLSEKVGMYELSIALSLIILPNLLPAWLLISEKFTGLV